MLLEALLSPGTGAGAADLLERLVERTDGVPFFLLCCAQNLLDALQLRSFTMDERQEVELLPWTVAQSVNHRLALLSAAAKGLLGAAAAIGRAASVDLLVQVTARSEEEVVDALDAATQLRLLEDDGQGGYRFSHDLIREVIEADLSSARRTLLHRRVAEALERQQEPSLEGPPTARTRCCARRGRGGPAARLGARCCRCARLERRQIWGLSLQTRPR
jgi:predicted ATPase